MKFTVIFLCFSSIFHAESTSSKPALLISLDSPQENFIDIGEDVNLSCKSYGHHETANIQWSKENGALPTKSSQSNGILSIPNIQPEDGGVYRCQRKSRHRLRSITLSVKNDTLEATPKSNTYEMLPMPSPPCRASILNFKPITIEPATFSTHPGDFLVLTCHNAINRNALITWKKLNNSKLPSRIITRNGILIIKSVGIEDSGRYSCESIGENGVISDMADVIITPNETESNENGITDVPEKTPEIVFKNRFSSTTTDSSKNKSNKNSSPQLTIIPYSNEITLYKGDHLSLMCTVELMPESDLVSFYWKAPNQSVYRSHSFSNKLEKSNVQFVDDGVYTCFAYTMFDSNAKSIKVSIRPTDIETRNIENRMNVSTGAPKIAIISTTNSHEMTSSVTAKDETINVPVNFDTEPQIIISPNSSETMVYEGDQLELNCSVKGFGSPRVQWKRSNGLILQSMSPSNVITFQKSNIRNTDGGLYLCIVDSEDGPTLEKSILVFVRTKPPRKYKIRIGERANIKCGVEIANEIAIWHRQDGRPFSRNSFISYNDLVIVGFQEDAAGVYECSVKNPNGDHLFETVKLEIFENEPYVRHRSPQITISPDSGDLTLYEGDELNLICWADGYPAPKVQWKKNTLVLVDGVDSSAILRKSNVELIDDGIYACGASNAAGKRVKSIKVSVRPNPPLQYKASLGDGARISCEIENNRKTLSWKRQDRLPLPSNSHFSGSDLIIDRVQRDAAGIYECVVHESNNDYRIATRIEIIIGEPPEVTINPASLKVQSGEKVQIYCSTSGDRPITIEWQYEENRTLPNNAQVFDSYLQIDDISMGNGGRYHCTATNHFGRTTKTSMVNVISNEQNCNAHEFQCRDRCIPYDHKCDQIEDCPGGEDELDCSFHEGCSPEEFECRDETCIDRTKICNEMIDCPDGEDENHLNCAQKPKHNSEPSYFSWPWNKNNF